MRFLFLILDFIAFFAITAIITTIRVGDGSWNLFAFLYNCEVMFPVFLLNVVLLLIFSFYDLKGFYKKHSNYFIELLIAFIVSFVISAAGIYFAATLFNIPTPKTNLLLTLLIFYVYVFLSRNIYKTLQYSQLNLICVGTSNTLTKIKNTLTTISGYKMILIV